MQRTLVLIKPEAVNRGLIGNIISKFELMGLKLEKMKMLVASREILSKHYPAEEEWFRGAGSKTVNAYKKYDLDLIGELGTDDSLEVGKIVKDWLVDYMTSGPMVAIVLSGNHAIEIVRKAVGNTVPLFAEPGTVRGDFSVDSPDLSNKEKRPVYNLIHASGDFEEAEREIKLWFGE